VVGHFIRALCQPPDGENGEFPEHGIELGRVAQAHAELQQMAEDRRTMGDDAEDVIDAPEPLLNVIKESTLALGELLRGHVRETCHTLLLL
jgi:hypothetical protein